MNFSSISFFIFWFIKSISFFLSLYSSASLSNSFWCSKASFSLFCSSNILKFFCCSKNFSNFFFSSSINFDSFCNLFWFCSIFNFIWFVMESSIDFIFLSISIFIRRSISEDTNSSFFRLANIFSSTIIVGLFVFFFLASSSSCFSSTSLGLK